MIRARALLAAALIALLPGAAIAQDQNRGTFDVFFGGLRIGLLAFSGVESASSYSVVGEVRSAGLVNWFSDLRFEATARGSRNLTGYTPRRFEVDAREGDKSYRTVIDYRGGVPQQPVTTPPRTPRPTDVNPATQGGTLDMATALYLTLRDTPANRACALDERFFDGARTGRITLENPRRDGDAILCDGAFDRIAGYTQRQMSEQSSFPFTMTYRPDGNGGYQVDRVVVRSSFGRAVMARR